MVLDKWTLPQAASSTSPTWIGWQVRGEAGATGNQWSEVSD